ncbi:ferredoxin [Mycolicibacter terrae]|uniref:Ferredoxin n=2 Tax=Mycolicibacter TaxID=1073531 RepID=A0A1A2XJ67_MYCSD|nr:MULTISPECIES: ferredoxin [Mycolicibacter]OBH18626.1 ferredoxin [Mycolicibacter sinensis]OBI23875.1 ferredoxin [Mycolicibacter sinensis]OBI24081.1 ferredoxin [Mycolicibacter sinensis]OBI25760.1 ferredoxin [Mycolicibacter sinensis]OBI27040.1 ferredoxin [Mycolicibacter sinensis]
MTTRKVVVDYGLCEANAICMGINAEVFHVDDEDNLYILKPDITPETERDVHEAIRRCPRQALSIIEEGD